VVEKTAPRIAQLDADGQAAFAYDIRVRNVGPGPAPKTTLQDRAPSGARFVRITHQPSQVTCSIGSGGAVLSCRLGDLVPAQSVDVQVDVVVKGSGGATTTNVASASCQPEPTGPCSAQASATTRLIAPFKPPAAKPPAAKPPAAKPPAAKPPSSKPVVTCATISITPSALTADGKPHDITVNVRSGGAGVAGAAVLFKGPGVLRVVRVGSDGSSVVTLTPRRAGILTVGLRGVRVCQVQKVGIAQVATPPVTG
jgi:hypothetical protein